MTAPTVSAALASQMIAEAEKIQPRDAFTPTGQELTILYYEPLAREVLRLGEESAFKDRTNKALQEMVAGEAPLKAGNAALRRTLAEALDHLDFVLPMAKGYALDHDVGNNRDIVDSAQAFAWKTRRKLRGEE